MADYLTFALVAPIASFGAIAVGERRSGWDRPARSAVLGLIGACLGLEREDDAAQAALATGYGLALLCHAPGRLLADYHTAQMPSAARGRRFATRAEELAQPGLNTVLSRRDYRSGAWHLGALWPRDPAPRWSLAEIAEAMRCPGFVTYLGRKSCPLGLPLAPELIAAADAPAALVQRHEAGPEARLRALDGWLRDLPAERLTAPVVTLDASDADAIPADDSRRRWIELRRDQPRSRRCWQFDLREELVLQLAAP
ncbi:CRISPR system Cascade subunit CasD [Humitalea rosea]|uniref:CRISPR system Cascade subunit CasD n=1 Tax=Humitalea rosea TaxID=990373 RepID=A0A2W7IDH4_9PROT|nr:type I-E CRISPR-associated protein Cas5/CasD [Humitalea rosea]PZW44784.1 CRISPR system Cascade subunit CasD [Humitalea rosea]